MAPPEQPRGAAGGGQGSPDDRSSSRAAPATAATDTPAHRLTEQVAQALLARGETLAVVEASAGGRLASALTALPGSSRWFLGGAVPYSQQAKLALLGLTAEELAGRGAVTEETAIMLAEAMRRRLGATWGIAETGVAGPQTGRRSAKPAGLAYVAVAGPVGSVARAVQTGLDERERNQWAFAEAALALLIGTITQS